MTSTCTVYLRSSVIRLTELTARGGVKSPITTGVTHRVRAVRVDELVEDPGNTRLSDERGLLRGYIRRHAETVGYSLSIEFTHVDPAILMMLTDVPIVLDSRGHVVGFDVNTEIGTTAFALEVWTKLGGQACIGGVPEYGYTIFPNLFGGRLSGFTFANGLVSFNVIGARTRLNSGWGVGPYDLVAGDTPRLPEPIQPSTQFRTLVLPSVPPEPFCGVSSFVDEIDGGFVVTSPDIVDGEFVETSEAIINGGAA